MASIDDLRSENNTKPKFVPTITQGNATPTETPQNAVRKSVVKATPKMSSGMGIVQGDTKVSINPPGTMKTVVEKQQTTKPTIQMKAIRKPDASEMQPADFSNLPQYHQEFESAGITKKESIVSDIFGAGGPFEKYKEEKTKEYNEFMEKLEEEENMAKYDSNNESAAANTTQSIATLEDEDLENEYDNIPSATSYRQINIMEDEGNMQQNLESVTENTDMYEEETTPVSEESYLDEDEEDTSSVELDYAAPVTSVEAYNNATEIESVLEEEEEMNVEKDITKISIPVEEDDEEDTSVAVSSINNDEDEDTKESEKILKSMIKQKIAPVSNKLDISSFTVVKKATNSNAIFQNTEAAVAKWVLPATGIVVSMREMSGSDLEKMREFMVDQSNPDMKSGLQIVYDHIVSPKPQSFEKWMKTIAFADFEHLFMAVHIASFGEANYIPLDCAHCKKPYLTDSIKIMDMVKFKDDECKRKFWDLYNSGATNKDALYTSEIVPMSETFAIGFKEPSFYDIYVESGFYSQQFQEKYATTLAYLPYIDGLYLIDKANRALVPIGYTSYDNNLAKTFRSKVMKFDKVLNTLSSDQHSILAAYAQKINTKDNWFEYQIPETTCIHCGNIHPAAADQRPSSLVFLRNRLTLLATT